MKSKSELLSESIVDATELKKAALKNAEQLLLKKYGPTIEEYVERILEEGLNDAELLLGEEESLPTNPDPLAQMGANPGEDPLAQMGANPGEDPLAQMGAPGEDPLAQFEEDEEDEEDVEISEPAENIIDQLKLGAAPGKSKITLKLGAATNSTDEGQDLTEQKPIEPSGDDSDLVAPVDEEDINLEEIKNLLEEDLTLDYADSHQGSKLTNKPEAEADLRKTQLREKLLGEEENAVLADQKSVEKIGDDESDEDDEEKETTLLAEIAVKIAIKETAKFFNQKIVVLLKKNKSLIKEATIYKQSAVELREALEKSNLLNVRLYYKNLVLCDPSLNERQKNTIAEAITKANNVEKVKLIYEIRQGFVGEGVKKKEQTLEQLLESKNYIQTLKRGNREIDNSDDIEKRVVSRMKLLAGIDKDI